jgi:hypothetical protein
VGDKEVIKENRSFNEIIGSAFAPQLNSLAARGSAFSTSTASRLLPVFSGHVVGKGET